MLSDEDLADDLSLLSLGKDGPGPVSSSSGLPPSQPSSLPIYAPHGRSPERFSPFQNLNLTIPGGRQTLREPSDSGLSGGSPSLGHREFQEQATPSPAHPDSPLHTGTGIKYIAQPMPSDAGFAARSPISPRGAPSPQQPHHEILTRSHRRYSAARRMHTPSYHSLVNRSTTLARAFRFMLCPLRARFILSNSKRAGRICSTRPTPRSTFALVIS
jgi:hypothetical protein